FLDPHAAIVVLGGVAGALCLSMERNSLIMLIKSIRDILPYVGKKKHDVRVIRQEIFELRGAWRGGQRARVLDMADHSSSIEIRTAAQALFKRSKGAGLSEVFSELRTKYISQYQPVIEGWDLVGRLAPSFGMVGTVTGMVQLFRNMGADAGNLGGAMGMALLATLYGITFGAAVGSPMATRMLNQMNEYLATMDLLEQTVAALNENEE
ncbi:MAG: MotA/TolQ/ExbB proton channel family protein, partial [Proteobacteria bacterium]|nr:MotA/TolQ/ExbB proton channel family protein [Pseudomonadota bacterium]